MIFCYIFIVNLSPNTIFFLTASSVYALPFVCLRPVGFPLRRQTVRQTETPEREKPEEKEPETQRGRAGDLGRWPGTGKSRKTRTRERETEIQRISFVFVTH